MEEPHKGIPHIDLILTWGAHQLLLTRIVRFDLEVNQSTAGGRISRFNAK